MEENRPRMGITGGSSLLTIFAVLCLAVLAILNLSAYQSDARLFGMMRSGVTDYYEARLSVERMIGNYRLYLASDGPGVEDEPPAVLDDGDFCYSATTPDGCLVSCRFRLDDGLRVEHMYWSAERSGIWQGDYHLPVYQEE